MFNSKKEFAQAMMDGGVYGYDEFKYYFDESYSNPFRLKLVSDKESASLEDSWCFYNKVKEVKPWYESIPKNGRLCWVWDDNLNKRLRVVVKCNENAYFKYVVDDGAAWINAEPLTNEEIKAFLQGDDNEE